MSEPESYEELLREHVDQIRALAEDALAMLDSLRDDDSPLVPPGQPTWVLGQIANQVIAAQAVVAEHDVGDAEAGPEDA